MKIATITVCCSICGGDGEMILNNKGLHLWDTRVIKTHTDPNICIENLKNKTK